MLGLHSVHLDTSIEAPAVARHAVTGWLGDLGRSTRAPMVELVVTEMVSNAVLHAAAPVDMTLSLQGDCLHVEVSDGAPDRQLIRRVPGPNGGYGLPMISALSRAWGAKYLDSTKIVWADIDLDSFK